MPGNRVPCDVAEITTDSFKSLSSVIFGKSLPGGQKNPMKFKFQKTTVSFFLIFLLIYIFRENGFSMYMYLHTTYRGYMRFQFKYSEFYFGDHNFV